MRDPNVFLRRLAVPLAYCALILGFAWPLPAALADHLVLRRGTDVWPHIWNFAWMRTALLDLHISPYYTHSIFYPGGVPLVYHALNPFSALVSIPLQILFGLVPAFNLLMMGNLVAAALAAYWLARVLSLAPGPAFLVGGVFACSPPLAAALNQGQGELVSVFWMPLYMGLLVRGVGLRGRGLPAGGRRYLLGAGLALAGSALAIWYWLAGLLAFTAVYAVVEIGFALRAGGRGAAGPLVGRLAVVGGVALLALSPLLALLVQEQLRAGGGLAISGSSSNDAVVFNGSQDLLALFRPAPAGVASGIHGVDQGIGWTVLALVAAALILAGRAWRGLLLWGAAALALTLLALGPVLVVNGQSTGIPLPYALLLRVPGAAAMRVPLRFDTPLALCLAVLAGHGLAALGARLPRPGLRRWLLVLTGVLAGGEFIALPRVLIQPEAGPFFTALAAHPSPCLGRLPATLADCDAVLELPQADWVPPAMFHQAIDQHPMIGGYISRHYPYAFPGQTPGVNALVDADPAGLGQDIVTPGGPAVALQAMDYYGVRYVIVHALDVYPRAAALQQTLSILFSGAPAPSGAMTVYTVPRGPQDRAFLFLADNWYDQEHNAAGGRWRWTGQQATVRVVVPPGAAGAYTLGLEVYAVSGTRTLIAGLDGREITRAAVGPAPGRSIRLALALSPGEHILALASVEPAVQPAGDRRRLSLGYHALILSRP